MRTATRIVLVMMLFALALLSVATTSADAVGPMTKRPDTVPAVVSFRIGHRDVDIGLDLGRFMPLMLQTGECASASTGSYEADVNRFDGMSITIRDRNAGATAPSFTTTYL